MTDNKKYVKRGQALIIWDDPQRHEEVMATNRDKVGTPFQYAEYLFVGPDRHLYSLKWKNIM